MNKTTLTNDKKGINKPIIETIINSTALTLTALGVVKIQGDEWLGLLLILFGIGLEFFKYWGRKQDYW